MTDSWRPGHNPWAVAMTVTLATFMEVLDVSVANVALPHIAGNLSADQDAATWVLTSYLVANAIVLPMSGWLATLIGRKRFYMLCVGTFTVSSFLCGLAPSLGWLIFLRVLQGAGGGGLAPSEQAILADTFPPAKRGMAFAIYGMAVVLAPAIGPTLGGYITDHASWRWIFFINVPVGLFSLFLSHRVVEDPPWARGRSRSNIDGVGLALIIVGLGCLQYVLDKGQRDDWWSSPTITVFAITSVLCLVGLVFWELHHPDPILDVRLLFQRNFGISCLMMLVLGAVLFGSILLLPLFLQNLLGYSAQLAGEVLSPGAFLVILLLPLVGRLLTKVDARGLIAFGFVAAAIAMWTMTQLYLGIDFKTAVLYRAYLSIGLAFLFVPINTIAYVGIPKEKSNQVSSILNLARNLGGSVGISLATTMVARQSQVHQTHLVAHATPFDPAFRAALDQITQHLVAQGTATADATRRAYGVIYGTIGRQATTLAYIDTLWIFAVASAVMTALVLFLRKNQPGGAAAPH
jgi:DHA2 family multidrug resistance protein